jgi:hypothetical protein
MPSLQPLADCTLFIAYMMLVMFCRLERLEDNMASLLAEEAAHTVLFGLLFVTKHGAIHVLQAQGGGRQHGVSSGRGGRACSSTYHACCFCCTLQSTALVAHCTVLSLAGTRTWRTTEIVAHNMHVAAASHHALPLFVRGTLCLFCRLKELEDNMASLLAEEAALAAEIAAEEAQRQRDLASLRDKIEGGAKQHDEL